MLRCFNDCFAVLGLWAAIYCYQRNQWHLGSFFYTTGLNVKMSLLLPLPAMGILMIQALGSREAITQAMIIFQVSVRLFSEGWWTALIDFNRFSSDIHSGSKASAISDALLSSPERSSTSGQSTGDSSQKRRFCRSHSPLASWQFTRVCLYALRTHAGSDPPSALLANSLSWYYRLANPEIRTSCPRESLQTSL